METEIFSNGTVLKSQQSLINNEHNNDVQVRRLARAHGFFNKTTVHVLGVT